uniref:Uncharacterized protein n=1 Tax=Anguilla anguilla TaxID=7936 RepID=A0A0E9QKU6_ANGAN
MLAINAPAYTFCLFKSDCHLQLK